MASWHHQGHSRVVNAPSTTPYSSVAWSSAATVVSKEICRPENQIFNFLFSCAKFKASERKKGQTGLSDLTFHPNVMTAVFASLGQRKEGRKHRVLTQVDSFLKFSSTTQLIGFPKIWIRSWFFSHLSCHKISHELIFGGLQKVFETWKKHFASTLTFTLKSVLE